MQYTRRQIIRSGLVAGLGLGLYGCGESNKTAGLPDVPWTGGARPQPTIAGPAPAPTSTGLATKVIARRHWTRAGTIRSRANPMRGVNRITLHHAGGTPVYFADTATVARYLESIRRGHVGRGWADIGYHYAIDRAGRVWETRPIVYQGAHVKDQNEHNIGVLVMGNFDKQSPSQAQVVTMQKFVAELRRKYKVTASPSVRRSNVRTHQEWNPTACPGKRLQPIIAGIRNRNGFA